MPHKKSNPASSASLSPRNRAAALKNLEKAWEANRTRWELTPARLAASRRSIKRAQQANRGRRRKSSPAQLAASRRNIARATAALNARGRSPEHLAKLRRTIAVARSHRTPRSQLRHAQSILKHGLFSRLLRGPVAELGENSRDYQLLQRQVRRYLGPRGAEEEALAGRIADALWRHHRLYFAQAAWELERLRAFLKEAPRTRSRAPETAHVRAYALLEILMDRDQAAARSWQLLGAAERLLRRFVRVRSGRGYRYPLGERLVKGSAIRQRREDRELEDLITDPDARAALLEFELSTL